MMRTVLTCVSVAVCGVAQAADLPAYDPAPQAPMSYTSASYDWSGVYIGLHGGYLWSDVDYTAEDALDPADFSEGSIDVDGWLAGVQAGYNIQLGSFVLGVEGDLAWTNADGETVNDPASPPDIQTDVRAEIDWLGTLRGRAGYAMDRFLIYGTGGLAYASTEASVDDLGGEGPEIEDEDSVWGWTVGAGVEAAVTQNITVKAEYLYMDFGDAEYSFTDSAVPVTVPADGDIDAHSIKVGLNYKF
jgi:outer membrane immunogenic protein